MTTHPELLRDMQALKAKLAAVEFELAAVRKQKSTAPSGKSVTIKELAGLLGLKVDAVRKRHKKHRIYRIGDETWQPTVIGTRLFYEKAGSTDAGGGVA